VPPRVSGLYPRARKLLSCAFAESWSELGDALVAARVAFDAAEGEGLLESFVVGAVGFVFAAAGVGAEVFSPSATADGAGAGGSAATAGKHSGPQNEINRGIKIRIGPSPKFMCLGDKVCHRRLLCVNRSTLAGVGDQTRLSVGALAVDGSCARLQLRAGHEAARSGERRSEGRSHDGIARV
jgi:hypothetical protein